MPSDAELPPPHVLSIYRLSMLTTRGAPANQVETQVGGMLAAWTTELGGDRTEFRKRLDQAMEGLAGQEAALGRADGAATADKDLAGRQATALTVALAALRAAREQLGT